MPRTTAPNWFWIILPLPLLVLLTFTLAAWGMSYRLGTVIQIAGLGITIQHGAVYFNDPEPQSGKTTIQPIFSRYTAEEAHGLVVRRWMPLRIIKSAGRGDAPYLIWVVPMWLVSAIQIALLVYVARKPGKRLAPGLCPRCGYDLRATPDRCPECGTTPPPQTTSFPPKPGDSSLGPKR